MRAAFVVTALALALAGCSSGGGGPEPQEQPPATVQQISIHGGQFDPRTLTMTAGETLYFESHEAGPHTATAPGFDSGDLGLNEGHSFEGMPAGTYTFRCKYHPSMSTQVTVQ